MSSKNVEMFTILVYNEVSYYVEIYNVDKINVIADSEVKIKNNNLSAVVNIISTDVIGRVR